jgi:hypothetical protein
MWRRRNSTQQGDEARGHGPCDSTRAHLSKEVRSEVAMWPVAPGRVTHGGSGAHLCRECGPKLHLAWQRVDARPAPCLNLELVCGGTWPLGCRQRPRAHLGRGCEPAGGANFSVPHSVILSFYSAVDGAPTVNMKT